MDSRFFWIILFLSLFGMLFWCCENSSRGNYVRIEGELPIDSVKEIRIVNYMTGKEVYHDTIYDRAFDLRIDSLHSGLYQLIFTWDRHVVTPHEMKSRSRYDEQGTPKYQLLKNIWVQRNGQRRYHITLIDPKDQQEIEALLMEREYFIALDAAPRDEESKMYEGLLQIGQKYYKKNLAKKDSLRRVMYALTADGDLSTSSAINNRLAPLWLEEVKQAMEDEEIAYLKAYNQHPMVPYVLYGRIASQADFETYKGIYEALDPRVKEKINHVFEGYMQ